MRNHKMLSEVMTNVEHTDMPKKHLQGIFVRSIFFEVTAMNRVIL